MTRLSESLARLSVDPTYLSRRSGLTRRRIDELSGGAEATISEVRALSDALKLSISALLDAGSRTEKADLRFRKALTRTSAPAEARILSIIGAFGRYPDLLPHHRAPPLSASLQDSRTIELSAQSIRQTLVGNEYRDDPMPRLPELLDNAKFAHVIRLKNLSVNGAAALYNGAALIFVASQFPPRSLFTIAHELGHLAFGHLNSSPVLIDTDTVGTFQGENDEERLCDAFAASLLIPAHGLARYLQIIRNRFRFEEDELSTTEILLVSRYFGTSFLAAAFRFEQLNLLPRGGAIAFEREIAENHGSPEQLANEANLPDRTKIAIPVISKSLRLSLRKAIETGRISLGFLADAFGLSSEEMLNALA